LKAEQSNPNQTGKLSRGTFGQNQKFTVVNPPQDLGPDDLNLHSVVAGLKCDDEHEETKKIEIAS